MPDGGLITETNEQYYAGAQGFVVTDPAGQTDFEFTFNTPLKGVGTCCTPAAQPPEYALNNFKLYVSTDGGITTKKLNKTQQDLIKINPQQQIH